MDINSNSRGNHAVSKPKHISRLKKEMLQHRSYNNPFNSPPSSTGSHDTVSTTTEDLTRNLSNFSFDPDDEGTRRLDDDTHNPPKRHAARSGRFGSKHVPEMVLNTSAIARTFPEWTGLAPKDTMTVDIDSPYKPPSPAGSGKENVPPVSQYAGLNKYENASDSKRKRSRAHMQARVENESDCSTVLSLSPGRPVTGARRSRFANLQTESPQSPELPKRSLQDMVSKIRTDNQTTKRDITPKRSHLRDVVHAVPDTPAVDLSAANPTEQSFFLPAFRHLPDWTSGTLRFSTMKNGVPVFVRSAKSGVKLTQTGKNHGDLHAVGITPEDEEIFVSMDKLQEEVRELHDHDAMLQRETERLQGQVHTLQAELKRFKSRKLSDSAIGSESDASFRRSGGHNQDLEDQLALLRERLDQASRQVGVNDIHSAALAAERDEALHQASIARERATKLEAELEARQRDLESSLMLLQEKEALQLENENLLAENQTLREQRDALAKNNKALTAENDKLRRELTGIQKDLATTREELASVRSQYEALQTEKKELSRDHSSLERNNEAYFKENKKLQAQVAARDQHIADLKKGISSRDKMIDNIQGLTTDTAMLEMNADLEVEVERLQKQTEQQGAELHAKHGEISAKEGRIRSLKEQNLDLSIDNERLREENQRLRTEHEEIRCQWVDERHKVVRLNQLLNSKDNAGYLKTLNDDGDDCVRPDDGPREKEAMLRQKLERREAAVKKVRQLANKIAEVAEEEFTGKTAKVTRIVEPKDTADNLTAKSNVMNPGDEQTKELNLTQDSDFASIMEGEIDKLKETYRSLVRRERLDVESTADGKNVQTDYSLPAPPVTLQRSKSDSDALPSKTAQSKTLPPGILKKSSQPATGDDTGRYSITSAMSVVSDDSYQVVNVQNRRSSMRLSSNVETEAPRPDSRLRRNSETGHRMTTQETDIRDMAYHSKQASVPSLSRDARRVLDGICKHKSVNCNVCVRIATGSSSSAATVMPAPNTILVTPEDVERGKKTISAEKPVPVSDRLAQPQPEPETVTPTTQTQRDLHAEQEQDDTLRPSISPGEALAILIKETQDEIDHLQMQLRSLNESYFALDKSLGQRERRRIMAQIKQCQGELEAKSGHLYRLHDVLEGQKAAGQLMSGESVEVTVVEGLVGMDVVSENGGKGKGREGRGASVRESVRGSGGGRVSVGGEDAEWEGFD